MRHPASITTILYNSKGMTAGILDVGEIPEESHTLEEGGEEEGDDDNDNDGGEEVEEEEDDGGEEEDKEEEDTKGMEDIEVKKKLETVRLGTLYLFSITSHYKL